MAARKKNHFSTQGDIDSTENTSARDASERDAIFENMKHVARTIVRTFGRNCEIAIHDFQDMEHSLIHLEGTVTGRSLGAPITNLVVKEWRKNGDEVEDIINYSSTSKNGHKLKSSTVFLRNGKKNVIGAFCVNFDLQDYESIKNTLEDLTRIEAREKNISETFASYMNETTDAIMDAAIKKAGKHPSAMTREEKIEFVRILDEEGAFLVKGMVGSIAGAMNVSIYTVYNYVRQIKNGQH